jgi:hypothetical protein
MYHTYDLKFTMAVIEKKLIRVPTVTVKYVTAKVCTVFKKVSTAHQFLMALCNAIPTSISGNKIGCNMNGLPRWYSVVGNV